MLGVFRKFLAEDGHTTDVIMLHAGETLPDDTRNYDALWVLGGPMDVWQDEAYPWLVAEKNFIKKSNK